MSDKVFFISGGGTGGHIYPAFTIVDKLLEEENNKVYYIGNPKNLEYEIAKKYPEVTFLGVGVTGMPRKLSLAILLWAIRFMIAVIKAIGYTKKYNPDAIFTTGGYVSAPIVFAAKILNRPYMIHDCDSVPGLVSKFAAPSAKVVSVAFENSKKILKSNNIIYNGNPIRKVFFEVTKKEAREKLNIPDNKKVIFAMGGSQGAKTINTAMCTILKTLSEELNAFVILQTGKNKYYEVLNKLNEIYPEYKNNPNLMVRPYFDDMVYPLKASDIVISRAGSLSLTEIIQCYCASILVPYPYATQDHQRKNAREMCDKGVSIYLEDSDCTSENLLAEIKKINDEKLQQMSECAKKLSKSNPTEEIVKQLKSTIKGCERN